MADNAIVEVAESAAVSAAGSTTPYVVHMLTEMFTTMGKENEDRFDFLRNLLEETANGPVAATGGGNELEDAAAPSSTEPTGQLEYFEAQPDKRKTKNGAATKADLLHNSIGSYGGLSGDVADAASQLDGYILTFMSRRWDNSRSARKPYDVTNTFLLEIRAFLVQITEASARTRTGLRELKTAARRVFNRFSYITGVERQAKFLFGQLLSSNNRSIYGNMVCDRQNPRANNMRQILIRLIEFLSLTKNHLLVLISHNVAGPDFKRVTDGASTIVTQLRRCMQAWLPTVNSGKGHPNIKKVLELLSQPGPCDTSTVLTVSKLLRPRGPDESNPTLDNIFRKTPAAQVPRQLPDLDHNHVDLQKSYVHLIEALLTMMVVFQDVARPECILKVGGENLYNTHAWPVIRTYMNLVKELVTHTKDKVECLRGRLNTFYKEYQDIEAKGSSKLSMKELGTWRDDCLRIEPNLGRFRIISEDVLDAINHLMALRETYNVKSEQRKALESMRALHDASKFPSEICGILTSIAGLAVRIHESEPGSPAYCVRAQHGQDSRSIIAASLASTEGAVAGVAGSCAAVATSRIVVDTHLAQGAGGIARERIEGEAAVAAAAAPSSSSTAASQLAGPAYTANIGRRMADRQPQYWTQSDVVDWCYERKLPEAIKQRLVQQASGNDQGICPAAYLLYEIGSHQKAMHDERSESHINYWVAAMDAINGSSGTSAQREEKFIQMARITGLLNDVIDAGLDRATWYRRASDWVKEAQNFRMQQLVEHCTSLSDHQVVFQGSPWIERLGVIVRDLSDEHKLILLVAVQDRLVAGQDLVIEDGDDRLMRMVERPLRGVVTRMKETEPLLATSVIYGLKEQSMRIHRELAEKIVYGIATNLNIDASYALTGIRCSCQKVYVNWLNEISQQRQSKQRRAELAGMNCDEARGILLPMDTFSIPNFGNDDDDSTNSTFYAVLGVARNAEPSEIRRKYRGLMQQYHVDKLAQRYAARGQTLTEQDKERALWRTQEIAAAYDTLMDPHKRAVYDVEFPPVLDTSNDSACWRTLRLFYQRLSCWVKRRWIKVMQHGWKGRACFVSGLLLMLAGIGMACFTGGTSLALTAKGAMITASLTTAFMGFGQFTHVWNSHHDTLKMSGVARSMMWWGLGGGLAGAATIVFLPTSFVGAYFAKGALVGVAAQAAAIMDQKKYLKQSISSTLMDLVAGAAISSVLCGGFGVISGADVSSAAVSETVAQSSHSMGVIGAGVTAAIIAPSQRHMITGDIHRRCPACFPKCVSKDALLPSTIIRTSQVLESFICRSCQPDGTDWANAMCAADVRYHCVQCEFVCCGKCYKNASGQSSLAEHLSYAEARRARVAEEQARADAEARAAEATGGTHATNESTL